MVMSPRLQQISRSVGMQQRNRAATKDRIEAQVSKQHTVSGVFYVQGTGEAVATVSFPVRFIERPILAPGFELHPDSAAIDGQFPTFSVTVRDWVLEERGSNQKFFVGANLLVVTTGPTGQNGWVHWSFSGRAITSPYSTSQTADSVI